MTISSEREKLYNKLISESSNTPLLELNNIYIPNNNRIFLKIEYENPVGSIHMRVYPYVYRKAELQGFLKPGITPVIEAILGNAGAAFVYCANVLGYNIPYPPKVIVPGNISNNRLNQLIQLGANLVFSPPERFNIGYVEILEQELGNARKKIKEKNKIDPSRLYAVSKTRKDAKLAYTNLVNEVFQECKKKNLPTIQYFVGIVGSGTSISGIGERIKELNKDAKIIAAEASEFPNTTSLLESGKPLPISTVPKKFPPLAAIGVPLSKLNLRKEIIDKVIPFDTNRIMDIILKVKKQYSLEIGMSSAGAILSTLTLSKTIKNQSILVCAYDELRKWD